MPLRNILIEVRQVLANRQELPGQHNQQTVTAQQQVLVINGRSASVALRISTPLRLMQTRFRGARPYLVPGVVLLDASTGFVATPRWDGSDMAELELGATQATLGARSVVGSSSSSSVYVSLGEWVTVADSEVDSQGSSDGGTDTRQQRSELQVRLSVR